MPDTRVRLPEDLYNRIKVLSGKMGKTEGDIIANMLAETEEGGKTLEEIVDEMEAKVAPTPSRGKPSRSRSSSPEVIVSHDTKQDPLDRVAEKYEKILSVKLMAHLIKDLELTPDQKTYLGSRAGSQGYDQPAKRDTLEIVREIKALDSLGGSTTDPEIKALLTELKNASIKALEKPEPKSGYDDDRRRRLDDLKEYALTAKMFGGSDERAEADRLMRDELSKMRQELHDAEKESMKRDMDWREKDLQRQINEIRQAPTELDQIKRMSDLAKDDDAIRAYMNTKLGVKTSEPMTPERIQKMLTDMKIPVGDVVKGIADLLKRIAGGKPTAVETGPPPPETAPPEIMTGEEAIVGRAAPELLKQPREVEPATFAEEPEAQPQLEPVEEGLPAEPESEPKPESGPEPRGKPKGRKKP